MGDRAVRFLVQAQELLGIVGLDKHHTSRAEADVALTTNSHFLFHEHFELPSTRREKPTESRRISFVLAITTDARQPTHFLNALSPFP